MSVRDTSRRDAYREYTITLSYGMICVRWYAETSTIKGVMLDIQDDEEGITLPLRDVDDVDALILALQIARKEKFNGSGEV